MTERKIYSISGPDRIHFLQGLITNDARKLADGPIYAALLTPQGKYLADFLLLARPDDVLLDIAEPLAEATVKRLAMYKLRANVQIAPTDRKVRRGTGSAPEGAIVDPRDPALGWRLYGDQGGDDGTDWAAVRVAHCIPESGIELTPDTYILEAGFERLNGVDFRKGCYVGQEVTARMKHKAELKKGLATVSVSGAAPVDTPILGVDGRPVGTLYTQSGGRGIAYLRMDRAKDAMTAGAATVTVD